MDMHFVRRGSGRPLLLIHGIGGSSRSWQLVFSGLVDGGRDVIAIDLPGHGETPKLPGENSIATLADAVTEFLEEHDLLGIDAVGVSMGARLVLELARRGGVLGAVVALDPGGFWQSWEDPFFYYSIAGSVRLVRLLQPVMPLLTGNPVGRSALLSQLSARPWRIPADLALHEMRAFAQCSNFDELLDQLVHGETQEGAPRGSLQAPLVIGWGKRDLTCFPWQAKRAQAKFPDAQLHWFSHCGHFPHWDVPQETVQLILSATRARTQSAQETKPKRTRSRGTAAAAVTAAIALAACGLLFLQKPAGAH